MLFFISTIREKKLPSLQFFVDGDAVILLRVLKSPLPSVTLQTVREWDLFIHFDQHLWEQLRF